MSTSTNSVNQEQQPAAQTSTQPLVAAASPSPAGIAAVESTVQVHQEAERAPEFAPSETSCCCGFGNLISRFFAAIGSCFRAVLDWLSCRREEEEDPLVAQDPNGQGYAEERDAEGRNALHQACLAGDPVKARVLMSWNKIDLNGTDEEQQTPMHIACSQISLVSLGLVKSLLENQTETLKKARVDVRDKNGQTPLHRLCLANMPDSVVDGALAHRVLERLSQEPNFHVNTPDNDQRTALHYAAQSGKANLVRRLFEMRANLKAKDKDDRQPLHLAAIYGQAEIVPILVGLGAGVNARDKERCTPILLVGRNLMRIEDVQRMATGRALVKEGAGLDVGYPDPHDREKTLGLDQPFKIRLQQPTTPRRDERAEYTASGTLIQTPSQAT